MKAALQEFHSLSESEFIKRYNEMRVKRISSLNSSASIDSISDKPQFSSTQVKVHCRNCNRELFEASDLRYREPAYFSCNNHFIKNLIAIDGDKQKFFCSDKSCNKELGRVVSMKRGNDLYMIDIDGIKFKTPRSPGDSYEIIKKWNKVSKLFEVAIFN